VLFDLNEDPHEQQDLAAENPDVVARAMHMLEDWYHEMALTSQHDADPMMTVLREGGPFHTRGRLPGYLDRLRATGRAHHARRLERLHPGEL
jgi:choline-sulfatase